MSALGYRTAELEAQERERLRQEQVKSECLALVNACTDEMAQIRDPTVQQLAAPALIAVKRALDGIQEQARTAPDAALSAARLAQRQLHTAMVDGEASAQQWSQEVRKAKTNLAVARVEARVIRAIAGPAGASALQSADRALAEAEQLASQGDAGSVTERLKQANDQIDSSRQAALDESIRKAVVSSLLATLRDQGFQVESPRLFPGSEPGGYVTLVGLLPSGRRAKFNVYLDGRLGFDLDGYEGRACAKELERVEQTLASRFRIQLGPPQITWKNPDKLSLDARDLPGGTNQRGQKG